jgi:hypothetical protein
MSKTLLLTVIKRGEVFCAASAKSLVKVKSNRLASTMLDEKIHFGNIA